MLVVARPRQEGNSEAGGLVWQLRCHRCGRRFVSLEEAYFSYALPRVGGTVEPRWCHRKCGAVETKMRLVRADFALRRLLESLLRPAIPAQAVQDLPRASRPWGEPITETSQALAAPRPHDRIVGGVERRG